MKRKENNSNARFVLVYLIVSMALSFSSYPCAFAHSSLPLSFKSIVDKSGIIVHGVVTKVESGKEPKTGLVCTWTTVKVVEGLKGVDGAKTVTYKQFGGVDKESGEKWISDMPSLRPGWEILLCLYPNSALGFTSPIGDSQGVFYVKRDPNEKSVKIDNGMPQSVLFPKSPVSSNASSKIKIMSDEPETRALLDQCRSLKLNNVKQAISDYVSNHQNGERAMSLHKRKWAENKAKTKMARE